MNKKLVIILMVVVGVLLAGVGATAAYGYSLVNTETIRENVFIDETAVGGMTYDQALALITEKKNLELERIKVTLKHNSEVWFLTSTDVQFKYDVKKAVDTAYSIGRSGNLITDVSTILELSDGRQDIKTEFSYNMDSVKAKLEELAVRFNRAPKEATFKLGANGPIITEDVIGRIVDIEKTLSMIEEAVKAETTNEVELVVNLTEPKLKDEDLKTMKNRLSKFYTVFDNGYYERAQNIRVATAKINGVVLLPGEVMSVDKQVGPRTAVRGFMISKIIVNNKYEDGIGGGLCQVSTTLYNAALYANLDIVARKNHSIVSPYIAPGRDSTVFGGSKDLKIKNNRKYPIYIKSYTVGGRLYFEIYGKKEADDKKVVIRTSVVSHVAAGMDIVKDPTLYVGRYKIEFPPHDGYVVKTYKDVYLNGVKLETVYLGLSSYNKSNGVKMVGTKAKPVKPAPPTPTPSSLQSGLKE